MRLKTLLTSVICFALLSCQREVSDVPLRGEAGHINERKIVIDVYGSLDECVKVGRLTRTQCARAQRDAMSHHPRFAEKFSDLQVCEDIYGAGNCDTLQIDRERFSSPRPVGFLVCHAETVGCRKLTFAPLYRNDEWGEFTGVGGGFIRPASQSPARSEISGVVQRVPMT